MKKFAKDFAPEARKLKEKAMAAEKAKASKAKPGKTKAKAKRKAKGEASPVLTVVDQAEFNSYNQTSDEETQLDDVKQVAS